MDDGNNPTVVIISICHQRMWILDLMLYQQHFEVIINSLKSFVMLVERYRRWYQKYGEFNSAIEKIIPTYVSNNLTATRKTNIFIYYLSSYVRSNENTVTIVIWILYWDDVFCKFIKCIFNSYIHLSIFQFKKIVCTCIW
jgi:hypothetical protein